VKTIFNSYKIFINCFWFSLFLSTGITKAQLLQDTIALNLVKKNINFIYNLQFKDAHAVHLKINLLYPDHPVVILLNGIKTYWENFPMLPTTSARACFEKDMQRCIKLCEFNNCPAHEAEYLLADLCARGMLIMFYADNNLPMEVLPLTRVTYKHLRRSFNFSSDQIDLNYFTGIYNYYREAYPNEHPVFKSLGILFPHGDMETGINQLKTSALKSVLLRAESYYSLAYIYLNFENDYPKAVIYSKALHEQAPDNFLYLSVYIKNLLLLRQYDIAEKLIMASQVVPENGYFLVQLNIFKGILQEKKYHRNGLAQEYYKKATRDVSNFGVYGNEYAAYAYYGLSRISIANGEKDNGKIYREKAMELAAFKKINFD
jgi:hypothetical protein